MIVHLPLVYCDAQASPECEAPRTDPIQGDRNESGTSIVRALHFRILPGGQHHCPTCVEYLRNQP